MSSLRHLLEDADPLRHEVPRLDAERERLRVTILRTIPADHATGSQRARLGVRASLAVVAMGIVALGYQAWVHGPSPLFAAVRFEMRLAEDQPVAGLTVAQVAGSGRLIYLHPEIVVSNDDIVQSWVVEDGPGQFGIAVTLLPSGADRLRQATAVHVGRPVAILIDGKVVTAPVVRSPIGDSAMISGHYTRAEAERIAAGIETR